MNVEVAISLVLALITKSSEIAALIAKARRENRSELTNEEWALVLDADDKARRALLDAIMARQP